MSKYFLNNFWIFYFFFGFYATSQKYDVLSLKEKREIKMRSHMLVHLDSLNAEGLNNTLSLNVPLGLYLSKSHDKNNMFLNRIKARKDIVLILNDSDSTNVIASQQSIVYLFRKNLDSLHITKKSIENNDLMFDKITDFGLLTIESGLMVSDSMFVNLWNISGKLPNFIYVNKDNLNAVVHVVNMLNGTPKIFGVVRTEEAMLYDVSFENFDNRTVNGFFTFPFEGEAIIPHMAGYYFSPDIISPTLENRDNLKEFIGYPLKSDYRLTYHFTFSTEVKNIVEKGNNKFLSNAVVARKDRIHGNVGYFSERAYIDTGIAGKSALRSNFSITAWVKPTELNAANGILSKGFNFVVKIHEGYLTFTSAGIKDYKSLSSPIPINEWTHIGLVHSSINNNLTFYINGIQTDKIEMISEYKNSEYNLLVGNNIWEEFFVGYLTSIKIWERELNANEILGEFENKNLELGTKRTILKVILGVFLVLLILYWVFKNRLKGRKKFLPIKCSRQFKRIDVKNFREQILCFGQLRVENEQGENIASKFSPMLKKIFVVIFLHSQKREQGISTKNLTEYIWPGMDVRRAKNTRGTTVQNLRLLLAGCNEIELVFKDKLWSIELGDAVYCDFLEAKGILDLIVENSHSVQILETELPRLLNLLTMGRFFSNSSEPWLDTFVEKFSIELIEQCFEYTEKLILAEHYELLFSISEAIYLYDDLNEKALEIKLNVLVYQGKLSLASGVFNNFVNLYQKIYKEVYPLNFAQFLVKKSIK